MSESKKNNRLMKKKYLVIRPDGLNSMIIPFKDLMEYINESQVGEKWEVEIIEMTEKEYKDLSESSGF